MENGKYSVFRKKCVFSQEFSVFCDLYFVSTGHWLYKKWLPNRSDCTLSSLRKSLAAICRYVRMGCIGLRKNTIFPEHPVKKYIKLYIKRQGNISFLNISEIRIDLELIENSLFLAEQYWSIQEVYIHRLLGSI